MVRRGTVVADHALGHSVHPEVRGLEPARWYFYRFRAGSAISPVGRTRTAGPVVAAEFTGTSISSGGDGMDQGARGADVLAANAESRGQGRFMRWVGGNSTGRAVRARWNGPGRQDGSSRTGSGPRSGSASSNWSTASSASR